MSTSQDETSGNADISSNLSTSFLTPLHEYGHDADIMQLSVTETATVLGKSARQIRYMIQQGLLQAVREGKSWRIDGDSLPLHDAARQVLQERLDTAKKTVDAALAPVAKALNVAASPPAGEAGAPKADERYSVRKLIAFETGREIYHALARHTSAEDPARQALFDGLVQLTQGCHAFRADEKAGHFREARRQVATAAAHLFLHSEDARGEELGARLEQELIPKLGGLVASQEKGRKKKSSRFDRFSTHRQESAS